KLEPDVTALFDSRPVETVNASSRNCRSSREQAARMAMQDAATTVAFTVVLTLVNFIALAARYCFS
ncbi:MAG: hypothetical protein AAF231_15970, partial [Pseudomonadota bacterium]